MSGKIVLVRHGRSAHVHSGWLDHSAFLRWREAYEAAGIDSTDVPPADLIAAAAGTGVVVASAAPRAVASAKLLSVSRQIETTPLLRELELIPPSIAGVRLPLLGWAVTLGLQSLVRGGALHRPFVTAHEQIRAYEAAEWLCKLVETRGSVLAVTHASFRSVVATELATLGWQVDRSHRRSSHWSAWSFAKT
jgi:hypothetical protein